MSTFTPHFCRQDSDVQDQDFELHDLDLEVQKPKAQLHNRLVGKIITYAIE